MLSRIYTYHSMMIEENVIMAYEGEIDQAITTAFTSMADRFNKETDAREYRLYKRLYHIMVECLQNICKHSEDSRVDRHSIKRGKGIIKVVKQDDGYQLVTGNKISVDQVSKMDEMLSFINRLSPAEIQEHYKTHLKENTLSDRGGAGLGFIDIVRKTGKPIDYSFERMDDGAQFFVLTIDIQR